MQELKNSLPQPCKPFKTWCSAKVGAGGGARGNQETGSRSLTQEGGGGNSQEEVPRLQLYTALQSTTFYLEHIRMK